MQDIHRLLKKIHSGSDWVGLRLVNETTSVRTVRNEKPERSTSSFDRGLMVEVLVNGHFGHAATNDTSDEGIQRATMFAREMAKKASAHKIFNFSDQQRPPTRARFISPRAAEMDANLQAMTDTLLSASLAMKVNDKIVSRLATATMVETDIHMVSSNGADIQQNFSSLERHLEATAQDGAESQIRTYAELFQGGIGSLKPENIIRRSVEIGEDAIKLLTAQNCPNEKLDLLIAPDQMNLQIHESIGHPLEYDRILGDERNYAGWSFVKPEDFGVLQYGSGLMNVSFDPTIPGEVASYAVDESGLLANREFLIQDGILQRGLGSLESQARLKLPGVANSRSSSWNRAPIDRMANINLEVGTSSLEQMIAATERGILMKTNKSWSIDDYRHKFQFGCEFAQLIENGKLTQLIKNPNYRGTTVKFWNALKMVGSSTEIHSTANCGKGEPNQAVRVGHSSPYCLFGGVEVFGA